MQIYVGREGDQRGPYSLEQIQQYLAQGGLQLTDSAWYEGLDSWIPLSEVPGVVVAPPEAPVAPRKKMSPQRRRNEEIDRRPRKKISRVVVSVASLLVVAGIVLVWKRDRIRVWYLSMSDHGLVGANLWHADLSGVNLEGANLADAILTGADLGGANLREAILRRTDLKHTNLQGANLEGANLKFANLRGASLKFANLKGASLWGTVLQDTDLRNANLEGATIRALLIDTNLTGANLEGANLSGAFGVSLEGTTGTPLPTKLPKLGEYIKEAFELELEE